MAEFKDNLLVLTSFPDPTPDYIVDQAVGFSQLIGARLSALMFVLSRERVTRMHSMGERLIDVPGMIDRAVHKSAHEANRLLDYFETCAKKRGVYGQRFLKGTSVFPTPDPITDHARLHDLTFMPVQNPIGLDELYTESVIFGSGRPTVLLPASSDKCAPPSLDIVALAWDYSRAAARALADAMPILEKAKRVLVFTVLNEKPSTENCSSDRLDQHLRLHGVNATIENVDAGGRPIGTVIENFVTANHVEMLVMGAFGHSRLREFVLGGATRSILNRPPLPVLLSH